MRRGRSRKIGTTASPNGTGHLPMRTATCVSAPDPCQHRSRRNPALPPELPCPRGWALPYAAPVAASVLTWKADDDRARYEQARVSVDLGELHARGTAIVGESDGGDAPYRLD